MRHFRVDGKASTEGIWKALGMFYGTANLLGLTMALVMVQETADRINKMER
jgi:hypothetical protein